MDREKRWEGGAALLSNILPDHALRRTSAQLRSHVVNALARVKALDGEVAFAPIVAFHC